MIEMAGFAFVIEQPLLSEEQRDALLTGVDEEGCIEDMEIETHYHELKGLCVDSAGGFLRVSADAGFVDCETRIPLSLLKPIAEQLVKGAVTQ